MTGTVDVLRRAREFYAASPSHAASGDPVEDGCVCLIWALNDAADEGDGDFCDAWISAHEALAAAAGFPASMVVWNAEHSTEDVLAAWDRAILAEGATV